MKFNPRMLLSSFSAKAARRWYDIKASADGKTAELFIYDVIDSYWGVSAEEFVRDLNALDADKIIVRLNTPGGSCFDGMTIFNALKEHPATIVTQIDGVAASMGSLIALAGDEIRMADNALVMIHNPWVVIAGDSRDLRHEADVLDKIATNMRQIYMDKTGKDEAAMQAIMDVETWWTAEEAKAHDFVTDVFKPGSEKTKANSMIKAMGFKNIPSDLDEKIEDEPDTTLAPDYSENQQQMKTRIRALMADMADSETDQGA